MVGLGAPGGVRLPWAAAWLRVRTETAADMARANNRLDLVFIVLILLVWELVTIMLNCERLHPWPERQGWRKRDCNGFSSYFTGFDSTAGTHVINCANGAHSVVAVLALRELRRPVQRRGGGIFCVP